MVAASRTLQATLQRLRSERALLDRQIAALKRAVDEMESQTTRGAVAVRETVKKSGGTPRLMSAVARKPIFRCMKQYLGTE